MTELISMPNRETVIKHPSAQKVSSIGSDEPVQFSGYLKKETRTGGGGGYRRFRSTKTWLSRWYELRGATLVYYLKKPPAKGGAGSSSNLPAGIIDLQEIRSVSLDASTSSDKILVLQSSSSSYRFRATDNAPIERWHELFLSRVAELQCPEFVGTLRALYMAYNPQLMSKVPAVALRFKNRQPELIRAIHAKYSDDFSEGPSSVDEGTRSSILEMESLERGDARQYARRGSSRNGGTMFPRIYAVGDRVEARYKYRGEFRPATVVGTARSDDLLYDVQFEGDGQEVQLKTVVSRIRPAPKDVERQDADANSVGNPLAASAGEGQDAGAGESVHSASEGAADIGLGGNESERSGEFNDDDEEDPIAQLKEEQRSALDSAVAALGEGFYTICISRVFDKSEKLSMKFVWVTMSVILFLGQLSVAMSLITDCVMPTCLVQDDCSYNGHMCMAFHDTHYREITTPVCMECRAILANYELLCKRKLKGKFASTREWNPDTLRPYGALWTGDDLTPRYHYYKDDVLGQNGGGDDDEFGDDPNLKEKKYFARTGIWSNGFPYVPYAAGDSNQTAIDYCFNEVGQYARGNNCHVYSGNQQELSLGSKIVLGFVALLVGLSVMSEKQQVTFMEIVFNAEVKMSDSQMWGQDQMIGYRILQCCCGSFFRAATRPKETIEKIKGNTSNPGLSSKEKWEKRIVLVAWIITILRVRILIPMVVTTVVALVGFQGTESVNIVLNGLATVFILELDDAIGETLFSEARREAAKEFFRDQFQKLIDKDNEGNEDYKVVELFSAVESEDGIDSFLNYSRTFLVETRLDRFTCQLSIVVTYFTINFCLYFQWPYESCARIMFLWVFMIYVILGGIQVLEQMVRAASRAIEDWEKEDICVRLHLLPKRSYYRRVITFFAAENYGVLFHMLKRAWFCACYTIFCGIFVAERLLLLWLLLRGGTGMAEVATGRSNSKEAFLSWGLGDRRFVFRADDAFDDQVDDAARPSQKSPLNWCTDY